MLKFISICLISLVYTSAFAYIQSDEALKAVGRNNGLCIIINDSAPDRAIEIAQKSKFTVHMIHTDPAVVVKLRKTIDQQKLYGRVSVNTWSGKSLPYTEYLANLIIVDNSKLSPQEVDRVLAPYGVSFVNGNKTVKEYPEEMDEWSHFRYGPGGTMTSKDRLVGPPRRVRWIDGPAFSGHHALVPSVTTMVSANGRIFYIVNNNPTSFAAMSDNWTLMARDAFNGKVLWERKIKSGEWGDKAWSWWEGGHQSRFNRPLHLGKRLVAAGDKVFVTLGYNALVEVLDAETGNTLGEYKGTEFTDEILYKNGTLYLSVNDRKQEPLPGKGLSSRPTSENVSKKEIWAIDVASGNVLWKTGSYTGAYYIPKGLLRLKSMISIHLTVSEKGVFVIDGEDLVKISLIDGKEVYRTEMPEKISKGPIAYHNGRLYALGKSSLFCFDVESGELAWRTKFALFAKYGGANFYPMGDRIWMVANDDLLEAYDAVTGEVDNTINFKPVTSQAEHHHRCYPNKATANFLITGRRAAEFTNLNTGEVLHHHWARGMCRVGLMPANGLLYKLPDGCCCYADIKLLGFYALAAKLDTPERHNISDAERLEKGEAYGKIEELGEGINSSSEWPAFRHDAQRSSSVKTEISNDLSTLWSVDVAENITPPVIGGGRVYISGIDQRKIYCFDINTGKEIWTHIADGRVDSPPTLAKGVLMFGSTDGSVTCLRISDGEKVWRFKAAPHDSNIMVTGQVESAWPVHGSVLAMGNTVYFTAGRSSFLDGGIYAYALDIISGEILEMHTIGKDQKEDISTKKLAKDEQMARADILTTDGSSIFLGDLKIPFKAKISRSPDEYTVAAKRPERLVVNSIFSDDSWFNKVSWKYGGFDGKHIAFNETHCLAVSNMKKGNPNRQLFAPKGTDASRVPDKNKIGPEKAEVMGLAHLAELKYGGYTLTIGMVKKKNQIILKDTEYPIGPSSMVIANDKALIAGWVDEVDPNDTWARIEGRQGGELRVVSMKDGKPLETVKLSSCPIWNGMAAANDKVFISMKDGKLICLGVK